MNKHLNSPAAYQSRDDELRGAYIDREVSRQFNSYLQPHIIALIAVNVVLGLAEFRFALPETRALALAIRFLVIALTLVVVPILRQRPDTLRFALFAVEQIVGFGSVLIVFRKHSLDLPENGYLGEYLMVAQLTALLCVSPLVRQRGMVITAAIYGVLTIVATVPSHGDHLAFSVIVIGCFFAAGVVRAHYIAILRLRHGIDYDLRRRMLPPEYVRKTFELARADLAPAVKMASTGILCVASDWRDFGEVLKTHDRADVVMVLSTYYDECVELMHRHFPKGDCALDWMADEFIVYVPYDTQSTASIKSTAAAAVQFARELVAVRRKFFATYQYPAGVDVGIAMGRASYGLCGTSNSRRMIAFGRPVSIARGLQHHIKHGMVDGLSDRIAMTGDVLNALEQSVSVRSFRGDRFLLNLTHEDLFLIEKITSSTDGEAEKTA